MIGGVLGRLVAHRSQARCIGGVRHAPAGEVSAFDCIQFFKYHGLDVQAVGLGKIRQVFLGCGARLHANGLAFELLGVFDLALDGNHKALAVVIDHSGLA